MYVDDDFDKRKKRNTKEVKRVGQRRDTGKRVKLDTGKYR
jgi:hypothetical protein